MKRVTLTSLAACGFLFSFSASAQFSITALTGFGGSDGWLAPGENSYTYLGTANNERGLAYGNGHLYLVSRNGGSFIRILDPLTGGDLGALNLGSGIVSGGTFAVNQVGVGGDGAIYVANLATGPTAFKVYRWADESSTPTVAYNAVPLTGARVGDSLDVSGSGSSTRLAAGFSNSTSVPGNNGYAIVDPTAGTSSAVSFSGGTPVAGDFRLGITFGANSSSVLGSQGGSTTSMRNTTYDGSFTGTLVGNLTLSSTLERLMDYKIINGLSLLATISTGDSTVRVWNITDPVTPVLLGSKLNTSGTLTANPNGTGSVAWGDVVQNGDGSATAKLYAMSSNQGIQAFTVTVPVPEPGTYALMAMGAGALVFVSRRRNR